MGNFREGAKIGGLGLVALVLVGVVLLVLSTMWVFGFGFFSRATADFRGETEAIEQTRADGDFRISAYNRFFDLCSAVQADEDRIAAQRQELELASESRAEQIRANITALQGSRAEKIRTYNADASKDFTVGQFRDSNLPYQLNINDESTTCAL